MSLLALNFQSIKPILSLVAGLHITVNIEKKKNGQHFFRPFEKTVEQDILSESAF